MINKLFEKKFPFAHNYFSAMLELNNPSRFPQSIILEGSDCKNSFYFALELARILNCKGDKSPDCTCTNCKWIKSYTHPAVNNVSQIHFKGDDDKTETQISVKQAGEIEKNLTVSSDYYRFFIFFSSKKDEITDNEYGYKEIDFSIEPLTNQTFNRFTINSMLKLIEEPPKNTTFVFLAKSKEDILPTIVSRSQVFKMSAIPSSLDYSDILPLISEYFSLDYFKAIDLSDNLLALMAQSGQTCEVILNKFIAYLKDILKQNTENKPLYDKIRRDTGFISQAIIHTRSTMQDKIVLEALFLKIVRGF